MEFELIRSARRTIGAEIKGNKLIVRAPLRATDKEIKLFLTKHKRWIEKHLAKAQAKQKELDSRRELTAEEIQALADRALQVIPERVKHYAPLVGVSYGRITIKIQKTRWGSCSDKGNLNFNCLLMLAQRK